MDAPLGAVAAAAGALVAVEAVVAVAVAEVGDGRERETAQTVAPKVAFKSRDFATGSNRG